MPAREAWRINYGAAGYYGPVGWSCVIAGLSLCFPHDHAGYDSGRPLSHVRIDEAREHKKRLPKVQELTVGCGGKPLRQLGKETATILDDYPSIARTDVRT